MNIFPFFIGIGIICVITSFNTFMMARRLRLIDQDGPMFEKIVDYGVTSSRVIAMVLIAWAVGYPIFTQINA